MRRLVSLCVLLLIVSLFQIAARAESYSGTWSAQPSADQAKVELTLIYRNDSPGHDEDWQSSNTVPLAQLSGVSFADFRSAGERKSFAIVRDAGSMRATGWFQGGYGSGEWTFEPSASFRSEMLRRGLGAPTEEQQFHLTMEDFRVSTLDLLNAAGIQRPSIEDLVRMNEHGVDPSYVAGMTHLHVGFQSVEDLIRMRDHGVDAAFVQRLQSHGYTHLSVEDLIRLRDHGF